MKRIFTLAWLVCLVVGLSVARVEAADRPTGTVTVSSPTGQLFPSSIHYVAAATTTCARGISAMGIYTAPYQLAYVVKGAKLDTTLRLPPGKYDTVVQEWDNCNSGAKTHVPVTVQTATGTCVLAPLLQLSHSCTTVSYLPGGRRSVVSSLAPLTT